MSTGQKIRNLIIKFEGLQRELKGLQREYLENKEFQDKQEIKSCGTCFYNMSGNTKCRYCDENNSNWNVLKDIKNKKSKLDEAREYEVRNSYDTYFACSPTVYRRDYLEHIHLYESAIKEKDEEIEELKEYCINRVSEKIDYYENKPKQQKLEIDEDIIVWLKRLADDGYKYDTINDYEKDKAIKLLKQLGIEE